MTQAARVYGESMYELALSEGLSGEILEEMKVIRRLFQENPDYDTSGCGRLGDLPRSLIEEYIEKFYPGIASENPQNDWISIDTYLQTFHAGWASRLNRK